MANPNKDRGTAWETAVVRYLNDHGFPYAERRATQGAKDCGDITGLPGVMIECKAERSIELAGYMDEVKTQTENAGADYGIAIVKRRNRPVKDAYVVMTLETWAELESRPC